ncbi:hypothetical protein D187_007963 [Cystobacter fuscus DSM 2262]|uniref:Uncharacterized protein n=1 Tax=Cystobacter fuscus (strain ATCC 25194 / DSM 2262 / NBRC 100088 / M29) TaxID=1242864 RepID=S9P0L4_CYSF2|nr:hypothetical protein [Cystobacter fuscus]EPX56621.1 hypothetical protein D187_007963 [Cystobacter fuscus DSM 2262]
MDSGLIKRTLRLLHDVERHAITSEQHEALENSRIALYFILERNEAGEFEEYLKNFNTGPLTPVLSFPTKEEADAWLEAHPAPPHGAYIGVGKLLYHLAYVRELKHRKLLPLPTQEEWARMAEEPEEEEAEEDSNHPRKPPVQPRVSATEERGTVAA